MILSDRSKRQHGMALLIVIWTLSLLAVLAVAFAQNTWLERHRVRNLIDAAGARSALEAALTFSAAVLVHSRDGSGWYRDGTPNRIRLAGADVTISLQDTNGCLNINTASPVELKALLKTVGVEDDQADTLAAAIVDWRDPDNLLTPNGAELSAYISAGGEGRPGNRPFLSTAELGSVLGMPPQIAERLLPLVTVYSMGNTINRNTAPALVLGAAIDIPTTEAKAILERRAARPQAEAFGANPTDTTLGTEPRSATQADLAASPEGPVFNVMLDLVTDSGAAARAYGTIWVSRNPRDPYRVLDWRLDRSIEISQQAVP